MRPGPHGRTGVNEPPSESRSIELSPSVQVSQNQSFPAFVTVGTGVWPTTWVQPAHGSASSSVRSAQTGDGTERPPRAGPAMSNRCIGLSRSRLSSSPSGESDSPAYAAHAPVTPACVARTRPRPPHEPHIQRLQRVMDALVGARLEAVGLAAEPVVFGRARAGQVRQVVVARQHGNVEPGGAAGMDPVGEHADRDDRLAGGHIPVVADVAQEHDPVRAGHGDGPVDGGQDAGGFQVDVADE